MAKMDTDPTARESVKMKFVGIFKGETKVVNLPIPLVSKSQQLDTALTFSRASNTHGPALCQVPIEWAGSLLAVGGNWQIDEKLTPELAAKIKAAKEETDAKMKTFAEQNEMVEA